MISLIYIDPSYSALIFQVIAGTILGGLITIKMWWGKLRDRIASLIKMQRKSE